MISFLPVSDIPLRFVSLNNFFSSVNGRVFPILVWTIRKTHDYHFANFGQPKQFFGEFSVKNISFFGFIREQRVYFWVLSLQYDWQCKCFCIIWWSTIQLSGLLCYFLPIYFRHVLVEKKRKFWKFFEIGLTSPIAHSPNFDTHFLKSAFVESFCLLLSSIDIDVKDRTRYFGQPNFFRCRVSWRKQQIT